MGSNTPIPGRTMTTTPAKPTPTAIHRGLSTRSPNNKTDAAVTANSENTRGAVAQLFDGHEHATGEKLNKLVHNRNTALLADDVDFEVWVAVRGRGVQ